MLLLTELKKLYPTYTFEILPIVLGATGLITTELAINLWKLKIKNIEEKMLDAREDTREWH